MSTPRPEKAAAVAEIRDRLSDSDAALLTEYRGLNVGHMAELRRSLRTVGGEYTIYKNTMVRIAVADMGLEMDHLLVGPTAIAFVVGAEGEAGDAAAVAKALKNFSKSHKSLVLKGGVLGEKLLSADDVSALADLPPREVLLAQVAGAFSAPMSGFASLLAAVPRSFAYGLKALLEARGGFEAAEEAEPGGADAAAAASGP